VDSTHLISRLSLSPQPIKWFHRQMRRLILSGIQPVDNFSIITVRPYGIRKGLGMTQFPQDYTLMHYGGTLRGKRIGKWQDTLMVGGNPDEVNAPTQYSWRSSQVTRRAGEQWEPDSWDEEV